MTGQPSGSADRRPARRPQTALIAAGRPADEPGRPRRHLYRLTAAGLAATVDALADATGPTAEPAAVQAGTRRARAGARAAPAARGAVAGVVP